MTEEQRYRERIQLEKDKIQLLKRIAEALEIIAAPHVEKKYKMDMSEVNRVEEELAVLNNGYKKENFSKDSIVDPFKLPD
jgi:hypothetical protein